LSEDVVGYAVIEGLGYGEIARMTGQKESTLRSIYSRGKAKLAQMIKAQL
jgi:DNA-directed RNA polymerase specialized sigma24 family protein